MDFLGIADKKILIFGVANRKSVAFHIAQALKDAGAKLIFSIQKPEVEAVIEKFFPGSPVYLCDFADDKMMQDTVKKIGEEHQPVYGMVHSVAFANFSEGIKPFHDTLRQDFLQATDISCFSFIRLTGLLRPYMDPDGAIVTISISTTRMAAESYGFMAPVKAALDSSICFLAKSLSESTRIRVNGIGASLLKTSASAGIPGYLKPYLFAEKATLRKAALKTEEVANIAAFLLSSRSSGINAQTIIADVGMSVNYFDRSIVDNAVE